jgi:hypothetical protein
MATGPGVNQGKSAFLEKFLPGHRDANLEAVNKAWTAAGNDGTISDSLFGKLRSRLGLTGKKAVDEPRPTETPTKATSKAPAKTRKVVAKPVEQSPPVANGSHAPSGIIAEAGDHDDDILDELEEGIDELIHRLRELGDRPDVVKALRRARRLLVRSHEG